LAAGLQEVTCQATLLLAIVPSLQRLYSTACVQRYVPLLYIPFPDWTDSSQPIRVKKHRPTINYHLSRLGKVLK
jgi:hypothetical protein